MFLLFSLQILQSNIKQLKCSRTDIFVIYKNVGNLQQIFTDQYVVKSGKKSRFFKKTPTATYSYWFFVHLFPDKEGRSWRFSGTRKVYKMFRCHLNFVALILNVKNVQSTCLRIPNNSNKKYTNNNNSDNVVY